MPAELGQLQREHPNLYIRFGMTGGMGTVDVSGIRAAARANGILYDGPDRRRDSYFFDGHSGNSWSPPQQTQQSRNIKKDTIKKFEQAIDDALAALENESCRNLFGKETDPIGFLQSLRSAVGPTLGAIELDDLGAYEEKKDSNGKVISRRADAGVTKGITGSFVNKNGNKISIFTGAYIRINSNEDGPFIKGFYDYLGVGASDQTYRAITIIHELGHAIYNIYGSKSSPIVPDANGQVNKDNSQRVYDACFKKQ